MIGLSKSAVAVVAALLVGYVIGTGVTRSESAAAAGAFDTAKVTHIGVIVKDIDKTSKEYAKLLGIAPPKILLAQPGIPFAKDFHADPNVYPKYVQIPFGNTVIELLEPIGGPSPWRNFLDKHGEGIHHIGMTVADMDGTIKLLTSNGAKVEFSRPGPSRAYVNAEGQTGFTFEIFQAAK